MPGGQVDRSSNLVRAHTVRGGAFTRDSGVLVHAGRQTGPLMRRGTSPSRPRGHARLTTVSRSLNDERDTLGSCSQPEVAVP